MNTSEHFFLVGRGRVSNDNRDRINAIAEKHGATFVNLRLPGEGYRYWFACRNQGEPFDSAIARAVSTDLEAAGLLDDAGLVLR